MTSRMQQAFEFDRIIERLLPPDDKAAALRSLALYGQAEILMQPDGSARYVGPLLPPAQERRS